MARNPAARKAAKAAKRKVVVAAKRKDERDASSVSGRVAQAAREPILRCLLSDEIYEFGMGTLVLIRGLSGGYQTVAVFQLDIFCLGVKDTVFRGMDRDAGEAFLGHLSGSTPLSAIEPEEARKLLRDAAAWGTANGFPPHKDYAVLERLFGDVVPAATDYTPRFGREGKVSYVAGPNETPAEIARRSAIVRARFGEDAVDLTLTTFQGGGSRFYLDSIFEADDDDDDGVLDGEAEEVRPTPA